MNWCRTHWEELVDDDLEVPKYQSSAVMAWYLSSMSRARSVQEKSGNDSGGRSLSTWGSEAGAVEEKEDNWSRKTKQQRVFEQKRKEPRGYELTKDALVLREFIHNKLWVCLHGWMNRGAITYHHHTLHFEYGDVAEKRNLGLISCSNYWASSKNYMATSMDCLKLFIRQQFAWLDV